MRTFTYRMFRKCRSDRAIVVRMMTVLAIVIAIGLAIGRQADGGGEPVWAGVGVFTAIYIWAIWIGWLNFSETATAVFKKIEREGGRGL